jgi:hypothetical protein
MMIIYKPNLVRDSIFILSAIVFLLIGRTLADEFLINAEEKLAFVIFSDVATAPQRAEIGRHYRMSWLGDWLLEKGITKDLDDDILLFKGDRESEQDLPTSGNHIRDFYRTKDGKLWVWLGSRWGYAYQIR